MKQVMIGLAVVVVVVVGAYLLVRPTNAPQTTPAVEGPLSSSPTEAPEASPSVSFEEEKTATGGADVTGETQEIKVNMANLMFDPATITIRSGLPYRLTLSSKGSHTFTVDKLGINFVVASGETKTFNLKVAKPGTYDVYCATPGHLEAGMAGKLIVQ